MDLGFPHTERDAEGISGLSHHSFMRLSHVQYEKVTDPTSYWNM